MARVLSIVFLLSMCFMLSCTHEAPYFEKNTNLEDNKWLQLDTLSSFDVHIGDSGVSYDISVNLRHNRYYPYANLVYTLDVKGSTLDTVIRREVTLAQPDGRWAGKTAGVLYMFEKLTEKDFVFPDTGLYTISIQHNMLDRSLSGVTNVGIKLIQKP